MGQVCLGDVILRREPAVVIEQATQLEFGDHHLLKLRLPDDFGRVDDCGRARGEGGLPIASGVKRAQHFGGMVLHRLLQRGLVFADLSLSRIGWSPADVAAHHGGALADSISRPH